MTFVERCLYEYKANVAAVEILTLEIENLMSVNGHKYDASMSNAIPDPVSDTAARKINLENKIVRLRQLIRPVEKLKADLAGNSLRIQQMREILVMKYINQEGNEHTQEKMAVSSRTFWRRVKELLQLAKKYFGDGE